MQTFDGFEFCHGQAKNLIFIQFNLYQIAIQEIRSRKYWSTKQICSEIWSNPEQIYTDLAELQGIPKLRIKMKKEFSIRLIPVQKWYNVIRFEDSD